MSGLRGRVAVPASGGLLLVAWVVWVSGTAVVHGLDPSALAPYLYAPAVLVAGVALGAAVAARQHRAWVDGALAATTAVLLLGVLWNDGPAKGPLGYANANAAVAVQVIALCGLAMTAARGVRRAILAVALLGAMAVIALNLSLAALAVSLPLLGAICMAMWWPVRRRAWFVAIGGTTLVGGSAGVVVLAARNEWPTWALGSLDPARQTLWADALSLWAAHPVTGGGPGSFAASSRLALDPDTASAHSSILQVGAETGAVGAALFAVALAVGLRRAGSGHPGPALVGVAAWTALGVHSYVDHLLEFAPVVFTAGIVVGWASAPRSEQLHVPEGERPGPGGGR